jgi:hypothetical protein
MNEIIHSQAKPSMFHSALQSEAIYRDGQRMFVVPGNRDKEWAWTAHLIRIKMALNYWRNGYKWRASWILAQR